MLRKIAGIGFGFVLALTPVASAQTSGTPKEQPPVGGVTSFTPGSAPSFTLTSTDPKQITFGVAEPGAYQVCPTPGRCVTLADLRAAYPAAGLSRIAVLEGENHRLKIAVAQLRATLADADAKLDSAALTAEQATLAARFIKELGGDPKADAWDWSTMTLTRAAPPSPAAAKPKP